MYECSPEFQGGNLIQNRSDMFFVTLRPYSQKPNLFANKRLHPVLVTLRPGYPSVHS